MNLRQVKEAQQEDGRERLARIVALAGTEAHRAKVAEARSLIRGWLAACKRPAVSCGGGKDSTATLLLCLMESPAIPVYCADPPNPLPDRADYICELERWLGRTFIHVPYEWPVERVLNGEIPYPDGLKIKELHRHMRDFDGIALGLRAAESHTRSILASVRGDLYQRRTGEWRCLPVLRWAAEDVLALILSLGCPVNPVYSRSLGMPSYEVIRDGTWWPRLAAQREIEPWIRYHYPEIADKYARAVLIERARPSPYHAV